MPGSDAQTAQALTNDGVCHLTEVVVETPTGLNAAQKELLQKFAAAGGEKTNPIAQGFMEKFKEFLTK